MRVLIVDPAAVGDQPILGRLRILGHETELAHSHESGIALARSFLPDVVALRTGRSASGLGDLAQALKSGPSRPTVVCLGEYVQCEDIDFWLFDDNDFIELLPMLEGGSAATSG